MMQHPTDNSTQKLSTNVTSGNITDSVNPVTFGPVVLAFNYATLVIAFVILICEIVAVDILRKCKRMPYFSRILSTNFILSDAAGALIFMVHQIIIFVFGINDDVTHNSRTLATGTMYMVSWASVAALSLERVVALKANIKYTMSPSRSKVYLAISTIWLAHVVLLLVSFLAGYQQYCHFNMDTCDVWKASKASRFIMMTFLVMYETILVISYVIIHGIAARHARQIAAIRRAAFGHTINNPDGVSERQLSATKAVIKIVLAFMLLHAPIIAHLFIFESNPAFRDETLRRVLHAFSYLCIQVNSFISLRLYVAKFDECKLYFYQILSRAFKGYASYTEELRMKVFDIVVSSESGKTNRVSNIPL